VTEFAVAALDHATLRSAGKELLSLALIDARNHTLRWAAALETAAGGAALTLAGEMAPGVADELDPRSGRSATSAGSRSTGSPATCSAAAASAPTRRGPGWRRAP
jgi:hypothetical protein